MADTGIVYAGTVAAQTSTGDQAWTNDTNAQGAANGTYAESGALAFGEDTDLLHCTNYDFAGAGLESGHTVVGVEIFVTKGQPGSDAQVIDKLVRCLNNGTQAGDNLATATQWPNPGTLAEVPYGAADDDLSTGMTAADWLLSGSGVAIQAQRTDEIGTPRTARVDSVGIRITYAAGVVVAPRMMLMGIG